jgi:hypothetical protein
MESSAQQAPRRGPVRAGAATLIALAMILAAFSLWTVVPLTWIYVGSKIANSQFPAGGPYALVFVGIVLSILAIAWIIGRLNRLYVRITGTHTVAPMRAAWLKSMRDTGNMNRGMSLLEAVIATSVVLAILAMCVWFFVAAGSPLPNQ